MTPQPTTWPARQVMEAAQKWETQLTQEQRKESK